MNFTKLVPEIYYPDIKAGIRLFVDCLEFNIVHQELSGENPFCVLNKSGLGIMIFQNKEYAQKFTPLLRLVTDNIEEVYSKISAKFPDLLHPNLSVVTLRPWGAKEFALLDKQIGIVIQEWQ